MDELKLLPANAIVAAFREVAEKIVRKQMDFRGRLGFKISCSERFIIAEQI